MGNIYLELIISALVLYVIPLLLTSAHFNTCSLIKTVATKSGMEIATCFIERGNHLSLQGMSMNGFKTFLKGLKLNFCF